MRSLSHRISHLSVSISSLFLQIERTPLTENFNGATSRTVTADYFFGCVWLSFGKQKAAFEFVPKRSLLFSFFRFLLWSDLLNRFFVWLICSDPFVSVVNVPYVFGVSDRVCFLICFLKVVFFLGLEFQISHLLHFLDDDSGHSLLNLLLFAFL